VRKKAKIIFKATAETVIRVGVLVSCQEKKARTKRGQTDWAKIEKANSPKQVAVNFVSKTLNCPVSKIILTIKFLKIKIKREIGIVKKRIWRKTEENFSINSSLLPSAQVLERVGKIATAKEAPIIPIGKLWRLLEKLKMAILPAEIIEARAVMTIKLICWAATPKTLGIINLKILFKAGYRRLKRN